MPAGSSSPLNARVALLIEDYDFFVADTEAFCARLEALRELRGAEVVKAWQADARAGHSAEVVRELLDAPLRPDLPAIDAAQLRRRRRAARDGRPGTAATTALRLAASALAIACAPATRARQAAAS